VAAGVRYAKRSPHRSDRVAASTVGAQDGKDSVVGLWLGETRTQGGLGNWIDFHADGTVEVGFGALVGALLDDRYRLEGTTLTLRVYSGKITPDGVPVFESVQTTVQLQGEHAVVASQWRETEAILAPFRAAA
jgi:hypothetical protein